MSGTPIALLSGGDLRRLLRPETAIAALRETYAALFGNGCDLRRSVVSRNAGPFISNPGFCSGRTGCPCRTGAAIRFFIAYELALLAEAIAQLTRWITERLLRHAVVARYALDRTVDAQEVTA